MTTEVSTATATDQLWDRWPRLSHKQRLTQFRELHTGEKADFFLALDAHDQLFLLQSLPEEQRHVWMRILAPDDAVDVIQEAGPELRDELLALLDETTRKEVTALLEYAEDDAGGLMNPRFARLRPDSTVDVAISYLRKEAPNVVQVYYAYVLDGAQRLLGVVSLRQLFSADPGKLVHEVMTTKDLVFVTLETDQKDVSTVVRDSRLLAVPVLDADQRMVGIVTWMTSWTSWKNRPAATCRTSAAWRPSTLRTCTVRSSRWCASARGGLPSFLWERCSPRPR
jgi:magnesium transporter